jgi:hypothetical protein
MPRSLPPIPALAAALTPPATSQLLGPLELAHRLAQTGASPASQEVQQTPLLMVDVRARRRFARGHLPHSHPIPAGLLVSSEWPEGDLLLVDDGNGEADRVREALHRAGYPRRGLPVERSRPGWCWPRWLGRSGPSAPALPDLQELLGNPDLQELLGDDGLLPELGGLRRA